MTCGFERIPPHEDISAKIHREADGFNDWINEPGGKPPTEIIDREHELYRLFAGRVFQMTSAAAITDQHPGRFRYSEAEHMFEGEVYGISLVPELDRVSEDPSFVAGAVMAGQFAQEHIDFSQVWRQLLGTERADELLGDKINPTSFPVSIPLTGRTKILDLGE